MPIDGWTPKSDEFDFDVIQPQREKPEVQKNITGHILGRDGDPEFDFDKRNPKSDLEPQDNGIRPPDLQGDNTIVNILDLFISTSPMILAKYGYPSPDLRVWKDWGKTNLNIMFNHYFPAAGGSTVASPMMAGMVGLFAIGLTMLPVILEFIKRRQQAAEEAKLHPPEMPEDAQIPDDQIAPVQVQPDLEPMPEQNDVSEHVMTVTERMAEMEQQIV